MYKFCLFVVSAVLWLSNAQSAAVEQPNVALVVEKQPDIVEQAPVDVAAVPEMCHQPKETGRCFALFYRYAYNVDTKACEEFIYGGCAGNKNNFESKELCERACLQKADAGVEQQVTTEAAEAVTTLQPVQQAAEQSSTPVA